MTDKYQIGRKLFAIGMFYLAILSIISNDYLIGRPPAFNNPPFQMYVLSAVFIIASVLIFLNSKHGGMAALYMALGILVFSFLIRHLPSLIKAKSLTDVLWTINAFKTLALWGGSLIVAASFFDSGESEVPDLLRKYNAMSHFKTIGIVTLSLFLIISGSAHFKFADFVSGFIPNYIPYHDGR